MGSVRTQQRQILRFCAIYGIVPGGFSSFRDARPNGTEMDYLND